VLQSVKDILQALVDDGLVSLSDSTFSYQVSSDKIGTSIYYWSFPSDAKRTRSSKIEELNKELISLKDRQSELNKLINEASSERQDNVI